MSDIHYTTEEYIEVLENLLKRVENVPFKAVDSTTIGNKYTQCSWGLCCDTPDVYNKPELNLFPEDFIKYIRISPKYTKGNQLCPHDERKKWGIDGCLYSCEYRYLFNRSFRWSRADKTVAINRINERLQNARRNIENR